MVLKLNGQLKAFNYLGHEIEANSIYIYFEIPEIEAPKTVDIKNDILLRVYEDQINLVHAEILDTKESLKLDRKTPSGIIKR